MLFPTAYPAPDTADAVARVRKTKKTTASFLFALAAFATLTPITANAVTVLPDFSAATFVAGAPVDNPFFPLLDTRTRIFVGGTERFELTVLGAGPTILGVQTTVQRDRAFEAGRLVEDTFDFYAQDTDGNVWYLGEDVTNYIYDDKGNLIGTNDESAWRAGVNGALPGYIMPSDLTVGFNYYQEFAPNDDALDQGTTFSVGNFISLEIGDFTNVLQVLETTELDPDFREFKYYAPDVGLILAEEGLNADLEDPEITFELVAVPEPSTLALISVGLGVLVYLRRKSTEGLNRK